MKLYKVVIENVAWFLIKAPESKPSWLESWIKRNVPEPIESIIWTKATEEDIAAYGNLYVWKLTDSFEREMEESLEVL
jgi:hypothetical protein